MARKDRTGNRKPREQQSPVKIPELGYYLVVTDTEGTERYSKSDARIYEKIFRTGNEEKALQIARQKHEQCVREGKNIPSQMCPCTTVYQLVEEIRRKAGVG